MQPHSRFPLRRSRSSAKIREMEADISGSLLSPMNPEPQEGEGAKFMVWNASGLIRHNILRSWNENSHFFPLFLNNLFLFLILHEKSTQSCLGCWSCLQWFIRINSVEWTKQTHQTLFYFVMKSIYPKVHIQISHRSIHVSGPVSWKYVFLSGFVCWGPGKQPSWAFYLYFHSSIGYKWYKFPDVIRLYSIILIKLFSHAKSKYDFKLSSAVRWPEMRVTLKEETQSLW